MFCCIVDKCGGNIDRFLIPQNSGFPYMPLYSYKPARIIYLQPIFPSGSQVNLT